MLVEAALRVIAGDTPIVQPKNLVQFTMIVFPSAMENTVEETIWWPLKLSETHLAGWNSRQISLAFKTSDDKTRWCNLVSLSSHQQNSLPYVVMNSRSLEGQLHH